MTVCEYDGDPRQWRCLTEEQCDDCFMKDHLKECAGCLHYDHQTRTIPVKSESKETAYEVVWEGKERFTKVDDNIFLK